MIHRISTQESMTSKYEVVTWILLFLTSKVLFIEKIMFAWTEFLISTMYVNKYFNPHSNEFNKYKCITHHYILQLHMSAWLGKEMNELNVKSPIWVSSVFVFFYIFLLY